ncbi:MAG: hypothetical protein MI748_05660 [Opitutales bacterium]|nr:hypothetical protein [Opitutales bacterium]
MRVRISRRFATTLIASICIGLCGAVPVEAQTPGPAHDRPAVISIELWSIDDRILHGDRSPEDRFLAEAQYTISGMIYGWSFRYVPESRVRAVGQEFALQPHASIPWGDPALNVREVRSVDNILYGLTDYRLSQHDRARRESWQSIATVRSSGVGTGDILAGADGKLLAIEEAIRDAIDRHLRMVVPNRPREAHGDVVLAEAPRIRPISGLYEARVHVLIRIEAVLPYLVY